MLVAALLLFVLAGAWILSGRKLVLVLPGSLPNDEVRQRVGESLDRAEKTGAPVAVTVQ